MTKYRRIEITAFHRRVMFVSGDPRADTGKVDISVSDADSQETIETGSEEGQAILIEAVRLLEETISKTSAESDLQGRGCLQGRTDLVYR